MCKHSTPPDRPQWKTTLVSWCLTWLHAGLIAWKDRPWRASFLKGEKVPLTGQWWPGAASCNPHLCHLQPSCLGSSDTSGWTSALSEQGQSHSEWPQSWPGWSHPSQRLSWSSRVARQRRRGGWGHTALQGRHGLGRSPGPTTNLLCGFTYHCKPGFDYYFLKTEIWSVLIIFSSVYINLCSWIG